MLWRYNKEGIADVPLFSWGLQERTYRLIDLCGDRKDIISETTNIAVDKYAVQIQHMEHTYINV